MHSCGMFKEWREAAEIPIVISNILGTFQKKKKKKSLGKLQSQCALHSFISSLAIVIFLKFNVTQGQDSKLIE